MTNKSDDAAMAKSSASPSAVAAEIRRMLKDRGSSEHAAGVQWFFKEEIKSHGWYTAALRKAAVQTRQQILKEADLAFLLQVADKLFTGPNLEEKIFAVFLLETLTGEFDDREFRLLESWLSRISSWADHDGLVHYLIAPMVTAKPSRTKNVFRWAKSRDRWHRRAACVALIRGARRKMFFPEIKRLTAMLLDDEDDMVQKGLGWLLRETAKYDPQRTVPYLMTIRIKSPRLVLRTACETLPAASRKKILT
jgi:3-methyladenine DNA glycosylase AlkD